jgi:hypothetical protein
VLVISLDTDVEALGRARKQAATNHLIQADINYLPLQRQFDLVLARHPDIDLHKNDWQAVLATIGNLLTYRGFLVITTYSVHEVETLRRWLYHQPLMPFPLEQARLTEPDIDGQDRFILAFQLHNLFE